MVAELGCRMGQVEQMIRYTYWNSGSAGIVIGVSGGVDSALAGFCCRAIGPDNDPGDFPSGIGEQSSRCSGCSRLCANLGMEHRVVSIDPTLAAFFNHPGIYRNTFPPREPYGTYPDDSIILPCQPGSPSRLRYFKPERVHAWLLHEIR